MNRRILISLAVFAVLILAFFVLRNQDAREKTTPIFGLDSLAIGKIRILSPNDTIMIEPKENGWWLSEPVSWAADTSQVNNFFKDVIKGNYPKTAMTTSKDAVTRYGLDGSKGLQVILYDKKGKKQDHVYFSNNGNVYDYLRYEGSTDIYQMNKLISNVYGNGVIDWRSPEILRAPETDLSSIQTTYPGGSYTLTHKDKDWIYRDSKEEFTIPYDNRAIMRLLNILVNLDTRQFLDGDNKQYLQLFKTPKATVVLSFKDGKKTKLTFAGSDNNEFYLMLNDDPKVLFGVVNDTIMRFTVNGDKFAQIPYGTTPPERKKL